MKLFYLLYIALLCILLSFNVANAVDTTDLGGFSSLRNDEKNLLKPMSTPGETAKPPVIIRKEPPLVKPVSEKEDLSGNEEEASGLKTVPESKEVLYSPLKPVVKRKTGNTVTLPEESEFFMKLSKEEEALTRVVKKPKTVPLITSPIVVPNCKKG